MTIEIGLKIDVDTNLGAREGIPALLDILKRYNIKATFLFSLGPDNTGRALWQIFKPGFFKKASRTNVLEIYGLKTLLSGVFWNGPLIGKSNEEIIQKVKDEGHEVGIHTYDHRTWQDTLFKMSEDEVFNTCLKAHKEFERIFGMPSKTIGAAGWQASAFSLKACDLLQYEYASDTRGTTPFFPKISETIFKTLQLPTTLPTLDELLGRPEYPLEIITQALLNRCKSKALNVFTLHTELEGGIYKKWFESFIKKGLEKEVTFLPLCEIAKKALNDPDNIPVCELVQKSIEGRAGLLACQG